MLMLMLMLMLVIVLEIPLAANTQPGYAQTYGVPRTSSRVAKATARQSPEMAEVLLA